MEYSEKIKHFMEIKGLNNRDLSNKLGKSEGLVSRWVNAEKPSLEFLLTMAKVFPDFDLNYILKEKIVYSDFEEAPLKVADEKLNYGLSITDIITDIESKLTLLKEKVAQNSHK